MADKFENFYVNPSDPADHAYSITPSSSTDLPYFTRAIYIGSDGDLDVTLVSETGNTSISFTGLVAGTLLPIRVRRVWETSTAGNLIGMY